MNKIRVAIIEDEIPAARLLHSMIASLRPQWEITTVAGSIEQSVRWFAENPHPDIVFLDIHLSDGNSFLFIEQAQPQSMIVFTTAYDDYAIRAFTVNSIDYLLKPIHKERLAEAIAKFESLTARYFKELNTQVEVAEVVRSLSAFSDDSLRSPIGDKRYRTRFLIMAPDRFITLQVDDIAYIYSENKVTFAVTRQAREHVIDLSLDRLSEQLDPDKFFRTNRQTIVNIECITRIEPYFQGKVVVQVTPPFREKILVSKEKMSAFKLWLNY